MFLRNFVRGATFDSRQWSDLETVALPHEPYRSGLFFSARKANSEKTILNPIGVAPFRKYEIGINVSSFDHPVNDGKSFTEALC